MTLRRNHGFTLIEMMIAGALLSIVTVYLLESFTVTQKAYQVVDQVAETQQNTRAISDLIEKNLRHAGFMVPQANAVCGLDNINAPDVLYVSDASAIDPGNQLAPTMGVTVTGAALVGIGDLLNLSSSDLDGDPSYDTNGDGINDADFQLLGGVIVSDRNNPARGSACGQIVQVNAGANTMRVDWEPTGGLLGNVAPQGGNAAELIAVPAHEYRVDANLQLVRDNLILASNVEDLQFAVLIDDNGDFVEDPGEYRGDGFNPDYDPSQGGATPLDPRALLEVRVSFVLRTRNQDFEYTDGQFQRTENRLAVAGNDGFRRRVQTSVSRLRNVMNRTTI